MPEMIRAFIALELPIEIKNELGRVGQILADQVPERSVRWVQPEKMHLTLRFLGDTAVEKLPAIYQTLDELVEEQSPFSLQLNELGCFPNKKRPRVIWAGLQGDEGALQSLKRGLDSQLAPLGWAKENKPFRAHLTLGRVKDSRQLANMTWNVQIKPFTFGVTAVSLIESQLTQQGPIYTLRHRADFG